jgi:hypothetical protein
VLSVADFQVRQRDLYMSKAWQTVPILPEWVSHQAGTRLGVIQEIDESQILFQRVCFPEATMSSQISILHGVDQTRNINFAIECPRHRQDDACLTSTSFDFVVWSPKSQVYILSALKLWPSHQSVRLAI